MTLLADILADGATGLYQFDELSGTVATDHGTGAVNGTYANTPTLGASPIVPGGPANSASFAAASSEEMTTTGSSITTNGSIEIWIDNWTSGTNLIRDNTAAGGTGWILGFDNSGTFAVRIAGGLTLNTSLATTAVRDGNLHQIVITKSGANVVVYVDNVSVATSSSATNTARTSPWHIARNGTNAGFSDVTFGVLAFYVGVVLTSLQVATHWADGTLAGAMTGSASASGSASGTLTGAGALSGTATAAGSASGTLSATGSGGMSGSTSAAGSASGTLTATIALTGTATATASASGALQQVVGMEGLSFAVSEAHGFVHADLPVRITETFSERWSSGQHIGPARPVARVEVRAGRFNRRYALWDNSLDGVPVDAQVGLTDPEMPWQAFWEPTEPYKDVPGVKTVELAKTFDEKGIASATITIDNIANLPMVVAEEDGGGTYHQIHRGYLAPLRGYVADGRTQLLDERGDPVAANEWSGRLNRKRQITVWEGYGDEEVKTFTGLIDDVDATSNPAVMVITARSFGGVFSDEEFVGWNIDPSLRDPVIFIDKDDADQIRKGGYDETASSDDGTHTADLVNDGDSDTFWRSQAHDIWTVTEYVEIKVGEGRYSDVLLGTKYPDLDVYVSVLPRALASGANPTLDGGDLAPDEWVDLSMGTVPGTFGGVPYIRLFNSAVTDTLERDLNATAGEGGLFPGGEFVMGDNSRIRLSFRNLWDAGGANFYAAVRTFYSRKRTLVAEAGANKWIRVGDISDVVKVVARWAGFREWEIENTGARLGKRLLANRGMKYMDLIDKLKDGVGFDFFIADPTFADESIGVPVFRKSHVVDTGIDPVWTLTDSDLLTSVDIKQTDEPLAYIIRARGRTAKNGESFGGDTTKRLMYIYRPPWSGLDSAGVIRHVVHTDELYTTADDVKFAAWYIALHEALESVAVGVQIPANPEIDLDDIFVVEDLGTGVTTRLQVRERRSTSTRGENAQWTMTLAGAITDTPDVQTILDLIQGAARD